MRIISTIFNLIFSDEFISRNEFDSTTTSLEAIILTTNSNMEQSKTSTEPIEEFDPIKRIKQAISNGNFKLPLNKLIAVGRNCIFIQMTKFRRNY